MDKRETALTAREMINALRQIHPDTVLKDSVYDDWSVGYDTLEYGFSGVSKDGYFQSGAFIRAYDSFEEGK